MPFKTNDTKSSEHNSGAANQPNNNNNDEDTSISQQLRKILHARIDKYYDDVDSNENNGRKRSEIYEHYLSQHDTWAKHQIDNVDQQFPSTSRNEMTSVDNYTSEHGCLESKHDQQRLGTKVDVVYSLLGMLGNANGREDMSATLLTMSNSIESCLVMRQSGCLPLLIQLIHTNGQNPEVRERAARALHNVVHAKGDEKIGRREARVLRLLEQIRDYCQMLRVFLKSEQPLNDIERHPGPAIAILMKLSFDEGHRHAMCQLGGLHAITELIEIDHAAHGTNSDDQSCITLRRYAGMALTNLTFGDGNNKLLLCSFKGFMKALVSQLRSLSDDLRQVTASVLRNLSWRADSSSKHTLREIGAVTALMKAAIEGRKESTLKSILSALWNLSAHCSTNKVDICAVEGALAFLVDMLSYKAPSKTLSIIENAGGILRNVSSHIALREDYRSVIRERGCLQVLLRQLRSPSLTVVSNACGTLWNLSARCPYDQQLLWDFGAVPMLRSLVHSKHKMISMGSSAALKNLLNARPFGSSFVHLDSTAKCLELPTLPSLIVRRQRAIEQEIDQNLSETCDNIEPSISPTNKDDKFLFKIKSSYEDLVLQKKTYQTYNDQVEVPLKIYEVSHGESKESMHSVTSTHSDTIFERVSRYISTELTPNELQSKQQSSSLHSAVTPNANDPSDVYNKTNQVEKRYALCYKNVIPELKLTKIGIDDRNMKSTTSRISWAIADNQKSAYSLLRSSIKDKLSPTEFIKFTINKRSSDQETSEDQNIFLNCSQNNYEHLSTRSSVGSVDFEESLTSVDNSCFLNVSNHKPKSGIYGDYAETDLDEPTNYSLRYAERNSDEDEQLTLEYPSDNEQTIEDTVKIYYTEDTPRDTSLNSSRTPSQSDLQYDKVTQLLEKNDLNKNEDIHYFLKTNKSNFHMNNVSCSGKKILEYHKKLIQSSSIGSYKLSNSSNLSQNSLEFQIDTSTAKKDNSTKSSTIIDENVSTIDLAIEKEPTNTNDLYSIESKLFEKANGIEVECLTESTASDGDDDDEDLLAACIYVGMRNNRRMQSLKKIIADEANHDKNQLNCYYTKFTSDHTNLQISEKINGAFDLKPTHSNNKKIFFNSDKESHKRNQKVLRSIKETCSNKIMMNIKNDVGTNGNDELSNLRKNSSQTSLLQTLNSENIAPYDSVARSEQALLELCINSGSPKSDKILSKKNNSSEITSLIRNLSLESLASCNIGNSTNSNMESKNQEMEKAYRRQRDPDAMIASLDRLTATLVQQTEAMREKEIITMKQSILSDSWNDDSRNDLSLPTISMSVPLIASFKSDTQECTSVNFSHLNKNTEIQQSKIEASDIIETEALKIAEALTNDLSIINQATQGVDEIKPPSLMSSILSSGTSFVSTENSNNSSDWDERNSTSLPPKLLKSRLTETYSRKKYFPVNVIAKRTLVKRCIRTGSLENLLNDCSIDYASQLENVKPPSMMDDILDNGDMENSMLSVASISSEIADSRNSNSINMTNHDFYYDNIQPIIDNPLKIDTRTPENSNILNESLENINPPSLLNEFSKNNDTIMDTAETTCSNTLYVDSQLHTDHLPLFNQNIMEKATNDNNTDGAAIPISVAYSSPVASTSRKSTKQCITPKQRRQLAKDRFRTYTIATKLTKKESNDCAKKEKIETQVISKKLTPKQRRQEDPLRFQTQILYSVPKLLDKTDKISESLILLPKTIVTSKISYEQKLENILLHDNVNSQKNYITSNENASGSNTQTMLTPNAKIVLCTLNESNQAGESFLDCETLSLVSNGSEAERSIQKSIGNLSEKKLNYSPSTNEETIKKSDVNILNKSEITENILETSESENENQSNEKSLKRPRIIKPKIKKVNEILTSNPISNSPRSIRGKRKILYLNSSKKTLQTPQAINSNIISTRNDISTMVRTTRAAIFKKNVNTVVNNDKLKIGGTQKISSITKNITLSRKSSIPQRKTNSNQSFSKRVQNFSSPADKGISENLNTLESKPLKRQNTFTKDESKIENMPRVMPASPNKSKITKPIRVQLAKVYPVQVKTTAKSSQSTSQESKSINSVNVERIFNPGISTKVRNKRYSAIEIGIKTLSKNINDNKQTLKNSTNIRQRPNSNSSIATCNVGLIRKLPKETKSNVATLWKKADLNKSPQFEDRKFQPCGVALNETSGQLLPTRLFRSSTFNGLITKTEADGECQKFVETSHSNSCDLHGSNTVNAPCKIPMRYVHS